MNKIIVANMKMYLDYDEVKNYLEKIKKEKTDNIIFCPSTIYIPCFKEANLNLGVQDVSEHERGNHTGSISCRQVKSLDISYVIIGHSEVKNNNKTINKKIKLCKKYGITPIVCIGENKKDIYKKRTIRKSLNSYLKNINLDKIIIAYEPKYMVNSNKNINVKYIEKMIKYIKKIVKKYKINDIMVLYGGNINKKNIEYLKQIKELDGYLIGRTSLNIKELIEVACN